jgi:general secretion pathway protein M
MATLDLPTGRNGRILAVLITLLALALVWRAVAAPLIGWHDDRQDALEQRQALADHMANLARQLPMLRAQAQALAASGQASAGALIEGNSDAVASAAIQEKVAAMASGLGLSLSSTETLAATREGAYRRIGVRVSLDATFPVVVHLLQAIETAQPSLLVNDLQIHGTRLLGQSESAPLNVAFTVLGFRRFDASATEPVTPPAADSTDE